MRRVLLFVVLFICASSLYAHKRFVPPTTPSSNLTFSQLEGAALRVNWTSGNGGRRIVIMRQGAAVTATPSDGTDYNSNATFGSGDAILPGQFVVFDGNSFFVDVSGLQPNTIYHVAIFEYNGTASTTEYLTTSFPTGSQSTLSAPSTPASSIVFSNIIGNSMTLTWANGNGQRRLVLAHQGSAVNANPVDLATYLNNGNFGSGSQIGTGNFSVFAGTGNTVTVTGLLPGTTYHFSIFEYNGLQTPVYLIPGATGSATTLPRPSVAASTVTFSSLEGGTMRVNWVSGNGARRIVIGSAGGAVTATPSDGVDYAASNVFGNGDAIQPGQFVLYDATNNFVDISGLQPNTTYHFRVFEYDGTGTGTAYLISSFASGSQATLTAPTTQASGLNFTNISV